MKARIMKGINIDQMENPLRSIVVALVLVMAVIFSTHLTLAESKNNKPDHIVLPDGQGGIGFDDMGFAFGLGKVLVPGGRTGNLYLIDPKTMRIEAINGFSIDQGYHGGHGQSVTSADEGEGFIFIADRDTKQLHVLDPKSKAIIVSAPLAGKPDYVRYIKTTNEVWVTEPSSEQIEVFKFSRSKPMLSRGIFIAVPGGPESLIEYQAKQHVYTHLWGGKTVVIDAQKHVVIEKWSNDCEGSRGIALDEKRGLLFVGCEEGKAVVLDLNDNGKELSNLRSGSGVDLIAYNHRISHLYLLGANSATMAVLKVSDRGELSLEKIVRTSQGSHCVVTDNQDSVWVCDPQNGQLLFFKD